jgi:hypothetical protein
MKERRIEHIYDCSADVFWSQIFLDDEYNRKLYLEELHFSVWRVLRSEERGAMVHRTIEAVPTVGDLPAVVKKLLSDGMGYEEHGIFDRPNQRYRMEAKPRSLANKLAISGELSTQPISERSCRRIYVGVGGVIEQLLLDNIEKSYNKAAKFTNSWIAEKFPQK